MNQPNISAKKRVEQKMRVLAKVRCPAEEVDDRRYNERLRRQTRECLHSIDVEAVYFGFHGERKAAYLVLNVPSIDKLPDSVEPLWLNWNFDAHFAPMIPVAPAALGSLGLRHAQSNRS